MADIVRHSSIHTTTSSTAKRPVKMALRTAPHIAHREENFLREL